MMNNNGENFSLKYYVQRFDELEKDITIFRNKLEIFTNQILKDYDKSLTEIDIKEKAEDLDKNYQKIPKCYSLIVSTLVQNTDKNAEPKYDTKVYQNLSKLDVLEIIQNICYSEEEKIDFGEVMNTLDSAYKTYLSCKLCTKNGIIQIKNENNK